MAVIFVLGVFVFGVFSGYVCRVFLEKHKAYSGVINVTRTPEKTLYLLELSGEPEELENETEVVFKVNIHPSIVASQSNHGL
jgi:hypothetical protein